MYITKLRNSVHINKLLDFQQCDSAKIMISMTKLAFYITPYVKWQSL